MILSLDTLKKYNGPKELISILKKYPNGIELFEFCDKNPRLLEKALFWAENITEVSQEEVNKRLERVNSFNCLASTKIKDSDYIFYSKSIEKSIYIYNCADLLNCKNCIDTTNSSNCNFNYISDFNEHSSYIYKSQNCTDCSNIINSTFCVSSHSINNGNNVVNSYGLANSSNCESSCFCGNCNNLSHSFFCSGKNGEYLLFNEPFNPSLYDVIFSRFQKLFTPFSLADYSESNTIFELPQVEWNIKKHYSTQTEAFWNWVKTLPNYNPRVLYNITFLPVFLN